MNNITEKLKGLPSLPGVYIMKSVSGDIIYVGKSKCLKNRVRQYFKKSGHSGKVGAMVENIADFEYIVTETEIEALVLECNLIKKHKPYYNILLKDSKQYPYIKISAGAYPKITLARKAAKDGAKYFGPYTAGVARDTLEVISKLFKIPTCKKSFPRDIGKDRPCLNYHINMCCAPCSGNISKEEYGRLIGQTEAFLEGKTAGVIKELKREMAHLSENMEFEKAAQVRDKIKGIEALGEKQNITVPGGDDKDIIGILADGGLANIQIMNVRGGKLLGRNSIWVDYALGEDKCEVLSTFIVQYYFDSEFIPNDILVNVMPDGGDTLEKWLCEKAGIKVKMRVPQKGYGMDLIKLAMKNAKQETDEYSRVKLQKINANKLALTDLKEQLGLDFLPVRIESYDISNTAGQNSVAAMVVCENGIMEKSLYRYFKIKTVQGIDDYASTKEVVRRRLRRAGDEGFSKLPTVIFADGGMGHAAAIEEVIGECGFNIPVFGMVKDAHHNTRAMVTSDGEIIDLSPEAFRLICEIQDEVHRVAITFHRKLNTSDMTRSQLDDIEGVGAVRKRKLLRAFGSVKKISEASAAELAEVEGMNAKTAETVYKYFHE